MPRTYSTYEAKAKLSELLDRVRKGDVVTITHRGEPVAEVRPIDKQVSSSLEARLDELRRRGVLTSSAGAEQPVLIARRKGALERFLESRE